MKFKLKEVLTVKGYIRGPFGSALKRGDMKDSGIPVYEQQNAIYNNRNFRYFIDEEKLKGLKRFIVQENDLIISCSGTVGSVSIIRKNDPIGIISQALLTLRPNTKLIIPEFLYYFFKSNKGYKSIISRSSGSVQVNIGKRDIIENIDIYVPTLEVQKQTVLILSNIDKKIEINNKINNNLQYLSHLLFKQWFVDFEFENEEGLSYKSSGGQMVDSDLGMIPKGWKVASLGDIVCLNYGKALTSKDRVAGDVKVYSSAGHTGFHNRALVESDGIIVGRKGNIGTVYYARDRFYCIDTSYYITQKDCKFDLVWVFELLKQLKLKELNEDSVVPGLNRNTVYFQKIVVPTNEVVGSLSNILSSIIKSMFHYSDENETLSNLRDTLLTKLMNGEIDLSNLEIDF